MFVTLPTGSGKSLCYAALPFVFDFLRAQDTSIVVVVCPLQSIMEDQVRKYVARGLRAAFVGKAQMDEAVRAGIANSKYQLVYMSPEAMLLEVSISMRTAASKIVRYGRPAWYVHVIAGTALYARCARSRPP